MKVQSEQFPVLRGGQSGFSRSELLAVTYIVGVMACFVLPAEQRRQDWNRQNRCSIPVRQTAGMNLPPQTLAASATWPMLPASAGKCSTAVRLNAEVSVAPPTNAYACKQEAGMQVLIDGTEYTLMVSDAVIRCGCGN